MNLNFLLEDYSVFYILMACFASTQKAVMREPDSLHPFLGAVSATIGTLSLLAGLVFLIIIGVNELWWHPIAMFVVSMLALLPFTIVEKILGSKTTLYLSIPLVIVFGILMFTSYYS